MAKQAREKSRTTLRLCLRGELLPTDELTRTLGVAPTRSVRKGERLHGDRIQPADAWILDLARWDRDQDDAVALEDATALLSRLAPALRRLDRSRLRAELRINFTLAEVQGGAELPSELVAAAGAAGLEIVVSILVMLGEPTPEEMFLREVGRSRARRKQ
jgi:Domain of unknown function (DUF4279)